MSADASEPKNRLEEIKIHQDFALRTEELALKRRELELKEAEQRASRWGNPLVVGVFVASLGLIGNMVVTFYQNRESRRVLATQNEASRNLAHEKERADLILAAINTNGDTEKASTNLKFYIAVHLIDDPDGSILNAVNSGCLPTSSRDEALQKAQSEWVGEKTDFPAALKDFCVAAIQGDGRAFANMGWIYENGFPGVPQDFTKAMRLYGEALQHGDNHANWNIGRLYEFGRGVHVNLNEAQSLYSKCAGEIEQCRKALANLGHNDPDHM